MRSKESIVLECPAVRAFSHHQKANNVQTASERLWNFISVQFRNFVSSYRACSPLLRLCKYFDLLIRLSPFFPLRSDKESETEYKLTNGGSLSRENNKKLFLETDYVEFR